MCEINEEWKPIKGYENLYMISNFGRLKHLKYGRVKKERLCGSYLNNNGYYLCHLYKNNIRRMILLHRLVAEAFVPNPNNYPFVNHKNSIRTDCAYYNLEWCTRSYNTKYSYDHNDRRRKMNWKSGKYNINSKSVIMSDKNGNFIKRFDCIMDAERELGILNNSIVSCLKGRNKTSGGYKWNYAK